MAENREKLATDSQSQLGLGGGAGFHVRGIGERVVDDLLGQVLAPAAFEFAAHRAVCGLGVAMSALRRGADVALPNHVARTDDHERNMTLMRTIRKSFIAHPDQTAAEARSDGMDLI